MYKHIHVKHLYKHMPVNTSNPSNSWPLPHIKASVLQPVTAASSQNPPDVARLPPLRCLTTFWLPLCCGIPWVLCHLAGCRPATLHWRCTAVSLRHFTAAPLPSDCVPTALSITDSCRLSLTFAAAGALCHLAGCRPAARQQWRLRDVWQPLPGQQGGVQGACRGALVGGRELMSS